uniref:NAD(P)-binding domain-containing protein n=1 Tax=Octactis speculum TaxID=3111310 RepID=A0A7S2GYL1_9STRA|mmetsp:Transcript_59434/g.81182  ORF Transcript_59434/g.81182 Transcript_59434/m.81182 type:complete len:374 (+) Transcript_59434:82-1203(+)
MKVAAALCFLAVCTDALQSARIAQRKRVTMAAIKPGSGITVLGPGEKKVQILAGKLASKMGYKATVVVDDDTQLNLSRTLAYGKFYSPEGKDRLTSVKFAMGADAIGNALKDSEGLVIVAEGPMSEKFIETAMRGAPKLKRVSLMSKHGGSTGAMKGTEDKIKEVAVELGVEWSITRVGLLRGGGPGNVARGDDFGLDEFFYTTNPELNSFQKDKYADQYLLGTKLTAGDNVDFNAFTQVLSSQMFSSANDGNSNRLSAASTLLQSLRQTASADADFGISSIRGLAPPTQKSWDEAFNEAVSDGVGTTRYEEGDLPEEVAQAEATLNLDESGERKSFKLGASTRAEETLRKQQIGHFIPFVILAVPLVPLLIK